MTSISDTEVVNAPGGLVELGYSQITSPVNITSTNFASPNNVISDISVVCDGSPIVVEVYSPYLQTSPQTQYSIIPILRYDGSLYKLGIFTADANLQAYSMQYMKIRLTPSAGIHTFGVAASTESAQTAQWGAGTGAAGGAHTPSYIRISKIIQASQLLVTQSNAPIVTSLPSGNLVTGQEVDLYVTSPYVGYQRYKWNGSAWYVIGDSRAQGVWQSFTPTLTQSSNVTFTINYAKYVTFGKTVMVNFNLSITSSGVGSNTIFLNFGSGSTGLPTAANSSGVHGSFRWFDGGVSNWVGTICGSGTTSVFFLNDGNGNNAGFSGTLTNGDVIEGSFFYEMA